MCQQRVYSYLWLHSKNLIRRLAVFASKVTNVDTAYYSWQKLNKPSEHYLHIYYTFLPLNTILFFNIICTCRQYGQRGKVLKDKGLFFGPVGLLPPSWVDRIKFLVLLSDESYFIEMQFSIFAWDGIFLCWWQDTFCIFLKTFTGIFLCPPPPFPPITFLIASPLKKQSKEISIWFYKSKYYSDHYRVRDFLIALADS